MLISLSGPSGSGKTYSALLVAAGLAGPDGVVGFIDTENGRGSMYADSPGIVKALPKGYKISRLDPPYSPARYIQKITAAEKAGVTVCVIDSTSHEWEGIDGCTEIAEKNKLKNMPNWAKAKIEHKRFVNHCLSSSMHIIFCLRARDKTKILKVNGKDEFISMGMQPIAEKNFVFEMLLSLQLDEQTKNATAIKVPEPLVQLFPGSTLLTKEDGERIRLWNASGRPQDQHEQLRKRSTAAAEHGMAAYTAFFEALTKAEKKALVDTVHASNKTTAEKADAESSTAFDSWDAFEAHADAWGRSPVTIAGEVYEFDAAAGNYRKSEASAA
jgi:hypothetical protein